MTTINDTIQAMCQEAIEELDAYVNPILVSF
jgi:hypothetical protein